MKKFFKWLGIIFVVLVIINMFTGGDEETQPTTNNTESTETATKPEPAKKEELKEEPKEEEAVEQEPAKPEMSVSQASAVQKAEAYIDMGGFSKTGLIKQLEFEKFSKEDSAFAVENIDVDWNEQAKIKAEAYMDMGGFSRQSLIDQLKFEGFTDAEATYGVDQVGL
ncbi:Ltp family lipoprotein [Fictibacillus nanhaiensis]|uniref:Ltp family lipoprotein n=1 Tax=Fictibacillus nanhaiensis TaxID=742169 RepID=UPI002E1DC647|nr:Ltp family lipoprotein [Fictibacillus nanhaiensis]